MFKSFSSKFCLDGEIAVGAGPSEKTERAAGRKFDTERERTRELTGDVSCSAKGKKN